MEFYEKKLAAAYVRGALKDDLPAVLRNKPLEALTEDDYSELMESGKAKDLKLYHFKKKELLPRVREVLGFLKSIYPESLLDVGSGRGVFLLPFLSTFPQASVTSLDLLDHRVAMLQAMAEGGMDQLQVLQENICTWDGPDRGFQVVTLLEVLEHIPDVEQAVKNAVRMARDYVVVSVPSKPDDNPEHIHLLTKEILTGLFRQAGCEKIRFTGVPDHLIAIVTIEE